MASDGIPKNLGLEQPPIGDVADETASVIELSGVIKWFDVSKGYGFIVPDDPGQTDQKDVLLHVTCLRSSGREHAPEGSTIERVSS